MFHSIGIVPTIVTILSLIMAYILGSFPTAYLIVKAKKGVDIRQVGSGNPGTSNVITQMGFWWGILVGAIDLVKGLIAVLGAMLLDISLAGILLVALAAVAGHCWSVFMRFSGGQGLGTAIGVLIPLLPRELVLTLVAAGLVGLASRFLPLRGWFQKRLHLVALTGCLVLFVSTVIIESKLLLKIFPVIIAGLLLVRQFVHKKKK